VIDGQTSHCYHESYMEHHWSSGITNEAPKPAPRERSKKLTSVELEKRVAELKVKAKEVYGAVYAPLLASGDGYLAILKEKFDPQESDYIEELLHNAKDRYGFSKHEHVYVLHDRHRLTKLQTFIGAMKAIALRDQPIPAENIRYVFENIERAGNDFDREILKTNLVHSWKEVAESYQGQE